MSIETPSSTVEQRARDRAAAIATAFIDAKNDLGPYTDEYLAAIANSLAAAFTAAASELSDEADAVTERRKKGWQSLAKEHRTVAGRLLCLAAELDTLAKEPPGDGFTPRVSNADLGLPPPPSMNPTDPAYEVTETQVAEPYTAATDPVTSQADVVAYLRGDTDTLPAGLSPEQEDRAIERAERLAVQAGNEVGAPSVSVYPTSADLAYVIKGDTDTLPEFATGGIVNVPSVVGERHSVDYLPADLAPGDVVHIQATGTFLRDDKEQGTVRNPELIKIIPTGDRQDVGVLPLQDSIVNLASAAYLAAEHAFDRTKDIMLQLEDPLPPGEVFGGPKLPPGVDASARRSFADLMRPVDPALFPPHWSWSQLTTSEDCGVQSRLARIEGVKQIPQWANVGGTAFHAASEAFDRGAWQAGGADRLPEVHAELIAHRWNVALESAILAETAASGIEPGEEGQHWRASRGGKENLTWWRVEGEKMLAGYIANRRKLDKAAREAGTLAEPLMLPHQADGATSMEPAIELEYVRPQQTPAGMLQVKGIIDRAYRCSDGTIMIKDLKTSSRVDGESTGQLGEYAWALVHLLDYNESPGLSRSLPTIRGCFYDARRQLFTEPVDLLAKHPYDEYAFRYGAAEAHRRIGIMQPHRSNFCVSCNVAYACPVGSS